MPTERLDPTGTQCYEWFLQDRCMWCGSRKTLQGCFCRKCPECTDYWLDSTREDYSDSGPAEKVCPECAESGVMER
jgi:hypothetical protein